MTVFRRRFVVSGAVAALAGCCLLASAKAADPPPKSPEQIFREVSGSVYIVIGVDDLGQFNKTLELPPDPNKVNPPDAKSGDPKARQQRVSLGSAVALTPEIAVTNCHVIADRKHILLVEGRKGNVVEVAHSISSTDICLLRSRQKLNPVKSVRSAGKVQVGERAYAIGTPRGLERSLSEGLISAVRTNGKVRVLQTTAPISPGNSGGGLFDAQANLVGITTLKSRTDSQLNFAVATDEFWPLPPLAAGGVSKAPPPQQPTPQQPTPQQQPAVAGAPPVITLQDDAVVTCGSIESRGLPLLSATIKCQEESERKFGEQTAFVTRLSGGMVRATVEASHNRLASGTGWSQLSTVKLKEAIERWAQNLQPANVSGFQPNPFPHYKLNIVARGQTLACARGHMRGGTGDKVIVWVTYCELGVPSVSPDNLATVAKALQFK